MTCVRMAIAVQAGAMQFERGSHALVSLPHEGQLWALGGGQPQRQLNSVEVPCVLLHASLNLLEHEHVPTDFP